MKKLIILLLFLNTTVYAQERFSKLYNSEQGASDLSSEIQVLNDGYLFCSTSSGGIELDTFNLAKQYLYIVRTNFFGDTIWTRKYYKRAFGYGARISMMMSDSSFLLVGRIIDYVAKIQENKQRDIFLIKINLQGDTLWTKTISLGAGDELPRSVIKTKDGGYAIMGQSCNQAISNCDYFLIKLDSSVNEVFRKRFSYNDTSFEQTGGIIEMEDSSLYLFGNTQNVIDGEKAFLVKTNKNGELIWQKIIGLDSYRKFGLSIHKFKTTIMLNILYATTQSNSGNVTLVNIDTSGLIVSEKYLGGNNSDQINKLLIMPDSSILCVGQSYSFSTSKYVKAWIVKLNANGDTVWQKIYGSENVPDLSEIIAQFFDIKPIENGFIVMGNALKSGPNPINQDVWLLRLDSMGCLYENCIMPTGVQMEEKKEQELMIYPNPSNDKIQLLSTSKIFSYEIIDFTGRLVLSGNYEEEVDITGLAQGIYIVKVTTDNQQYIYSKLKKN